jgi:DNA-binding transcriptional regulator LsrR (DeoR family)
VWDLVKNRPVVANALRSVYQGDLLLATVGLGDRRIAHDDATHNELLATVRAEKVVASLCTLMLDENGHEVRTRYVGVGPTYEGVREMARDPSRRVITATGGSASYMVPVRAAVRGGLVSDLITETVTAAWLVGEITYPTA